MKPVELYKKNCDPYTVTTQEALTYHLNQGWVEDPDDLEVETHVIAPVKPYNVLDEKPAGEPLADVLCSASADEVKSLNEALTAKDDLIKEMQTDFEDTFTGMNTVIKRLKEQLTDAGLVPITDVPAPPAGAPAAPRRKR